MDIKETLNEARQAIEAGDFEKAETLKNAAKELVDLASIENSAAKIDDAKAARVAADEAPPVKTVGHQVEVLEDETDKKARDRKSTRLNSSHSSVSRMPSSA